MSSTILTPASPPALHFDNTLGAALIGVIIAATLFGVTNVQALTYYTNSARDPRYLRFTVAFLWLLDALHVALVSHFIYFYVVTNFTNVSIITKPTWSFCLEVLVTTISDFIVRTYYTRRVWILSKGNWFLTLGPAIFAVTHLVCGIAATVKFFSYHSMLQIADIAWLLYLSLGSDVSADVWVAATLSYFLGKNRTGFKSTDTIITVLTIYIISTGFLTSLCSICTLATYAALPNNYVFVGFYFALPKLYFNSLLATLNARDRIRGGSNGDEDVISAGPIAYQMRRMFNSSTGPNASKDTASSGTINISTCSPMRSDFKSGEKENRAFAVTVQTETAYSSDVVEDNQEKFKSVLPL